MNVLCESCIEADYKIKHRVKTLPAEVVNLNIRNTDACEKCGQRFHKDGKLSFTEKYRQYV